MLKPKDRRYRPWLPTESAWLLIHPRNHRCTGSQTLRPLTFQRSHLANAPERQWSRPCQVVAVTLAERKVINCAQVHPGPSNLNTSAGTRSLLATISSSSLPFNCFSVWGSPPDSLYPKCIPHFSLLRGKCFKPSVFCPARGNDSPTFCLPDSKWRFFSGRQEMFRKGDGAGQDCGRSRARQGRGKVGAEAGHILGHSFRCHSIRLINHQKTQYPIP